MNSRARNFGLEVGIHVAAADEDHRGLAPLEPQALSYDKPLCASLDGFTLHAATHAGATTRQAARRCCGTFCARRLRRSAWSSAPLADWGGPTASEGARTMRFDWHTALVSPTLRAPRLVSSRWDR